MSAHIIYLDQCAISSIVKNKDDLWGRLHDKLRILLNGGTIVCPTSQLHYEESMLSEDWRDELWAKCRELAGPWRFVPVEVIESVQLRRALCAHLGEPEESENSQVVHCGCDDHGPLDVVRQRREKSFQQIHRLVGRFHGFESARIAVIQEYVEQILMDELVREVHRLCPEKPDPLLNVRDFLQSQVVQRVPFLEIASRLWATIAQHIHSKVKPRKLKPSDIYDVQAMAYYSPYCDAMFVDNEFRKLACQRNVDVPGRYGVRLFSKSNREQFMAYLDEIGGSRC